MNSAVRTENRQGMESVIEFKLPALGENIEQGDLVRLMIAPGETVNELSLIHI